MKTDCNIIRDLLPLYADDVCSKESRALVDEHLQECPDCLEELVNLRKSEIEDRLGAEREDVIQKQKKQMGRRSAAIGSVLAWIFLIPVVICLFINRLQGGGMGWFLITLASVAVAASVTVVPLMVPENKLFWTFCAFTATVVMLFAVICLCTGGDWFFVVTAATLFGLSVFFLPFVIKAKPIRPFVPERKAVTVIAVDLGLFGLMMEAIDIRNNGLGLTRLLLLAALLCGLAFYVVIPELKKRGILK